MNLIFLGAPGVGKGTQARFLSKKLGIPHISTGEMLRENIKKKTKLGKLASSLINKGKFIPDRLVNKMVEKRLKRSDCADGFILDGYPRTIPQAEALDKFAEIDRVINFELSKEMIIRRITGRRTCPKCEFAYHLEYVPSKVEGVCDKCKVKLIQRPDETEDAVKTRLQIYYEQTLPLIEYYEKQGKLINIDASPTPEEIHQEVCKVLRVKCD